MTGDGLLRRRDEEGLSRFEQRTANKPKTRLDRKSPYKVRIRLPPGGVYKPSVPPAISRG